MRWRRPKSKPIITAGAFTDAGQVRTQNQDNYGCYSLPGADGGEEHLFVVADGMGGHEDGEVASRLAVEEVRRVFHAGGQDVAERLRQSVVQANRRIYARGHPDGNGRTRSMGTTCTVLVLSAGQALLGHVGDSRAYRVREGRITQLTRDHTVVEDLYREGILTDREARVHPRRHTLSRALGTHPDVRVDVLEPEPLEPGTAYVLCSDGLAPVADVEILQVVDAHPPQEACERLVEMANDRGGPDNVSVVVVRVG